MSTAVTAANVEFAAPYGVAARRTMSGLSDWEVRRLVATGLLQRIRHGWFATPSADPDVVTAVRLGGALSCVSALRKHGVWVPDHCRGTHVRLPRDRKTAQRPPGVVLCAPHRRRLPLREPVDSPLAALLCAADCLDREDFVVVCDSVLNRRLVEPEQLQHAFSTASKRLSGWLDQCDGRAGSGTETLVRLRLRSRRIQVRPQFYIPDVGYVDLLVGNCLVIEADSRQHHTSAPDFANDRRRDLAAIAQRYRHIRLTYAQVVYDWPSTERQILAVVRRRDHCSRPERGN